MLSGAAGLTVLSGAAGLTLLSGAALSGNTGAVTFKGWTVYDFLPVLTQSGDVSHMCACLVDATQQPGHDST